MDSGYYAAATGLVARSQALDLAATNLANTQTTGFRSEKDYFSSVLLGSDAADSQLGRTVNNYGVIGGDQLNLAQGPINQTGNPLDLAIEGQGFFEVQTPRGMRYTRDGSFHRTPGGLLVDSSGDPVMSTAGKPIPVPPGAVAIGGDGVLSVAGGVVATIGLFTFPEGEQLTPEGTNLYVAPKGAKPALARSSTIHQGALEGTNESVIQGTMDLILAQREAQMMQKALSIFYSDFNKTATEDLPRV